MMKVPVETDPGFSAGSPETVFEGRYYDAVAKNHDLAPDADRFLMVEATTAQEGSAAFRVITNWFTELERLVPTTR